MKKEGEKMKAEPMAKVIDLLPEQSEMMRNINTSFLKMNKAGLDVSRFATMKQLAGYICVAQNGHEPEKLRGLKMLESGNSLMFVEPSDYARILKEYAEIREEEKAEPCSPGKTHSFTMKWSTLIYEIFGMVIVAGLIWAVIWTW